MSTLSPRALIALREAHGVLMAAVLASPSPPGPLLHAAVEVADALEAAEDEAIEAAARVLGHLWPPARVRVMLRRAVQVGAVTTSEIAAWAAAQGGSGLEAESALGALLDAVEHGEVSMAEAGQALDDLMEGGERG